MRSLPIAQGLIRIAAPLAVMAFWAGLLTAALRFPGGYDWLYQPISNLLYPDRDPRGYLWAWAGVELCGLGGLLWTAQLHADRPDASLKSQAALWPLRVGFVCMCGAVVPDQWLSLSKGHEVLAVFAFLGICSGVVWLVFTAIDRRVPHRFQRLARLRAAIGASVPLIPVALAGLTQAYLALARPNLPWVSPAWRARGIPLYLSFAVWQWSACGLFSICLLALSLPIRRSVRAPASSAARAAGR